MFWKVIIYIDMWILNKFQFFQNWTQTIFGINCFWWAKLCAKLAYSTQILWIITDCYISVYENNVIVLFEVGTNIFFILFWTFIFYEAMNYIEETERNLNLKFLNKEILRYNSRVSTMFFCTLGMCANTTLVIFGVYQNILTIIALFFVVCSYYFNACTPLPPSESKVKQWLKSGKQKIVETFSPQPDLAPSRC